LFVVEGVLIAEVIASLLDFSMVLTRIKALPALGLVPARPAPAAAGLAYALGHVAAPERD
jgi:hypothetical protein